MLSARDSLLWGILKTPHAGKCMMSAIYFQMNHLKEISFLHTLKK